MFFIFFLILFWADVADFERRIAIHTSSPDTTFPIRTVAIYFIACDIEKKRKKSHLVSTKFCYQEKDTDNQDTNDYEGSFRNLSIEFIKESEGKNQSHNDNTHLSQTESENNSIFIFYLDRDFILHIHILPHFSIKYKPSILTMYTLQYNNIMDKSKTPNSSESEMGKNLPLGVYTVTC